MKNSAKNVLFSNVTVASIRGSINTAYIEVEITYFHITFLICAEYTNTHPTNHMMPIKMDFHSFVSSSAINVSMQIRYEFLCVVCCCAKCGLRCHTGVNPGQ